MLSPTNAQLAVQCDVLSVVLRHICETLAAPVAKEVEASLQGTFAARPAPDGEDADAAQAMALVPLLAALKR